MLRHQLHWLPIWQRISYKIALITYQVKSAVPSCVHGVFTEQLYSCMDITLFRQEFAIYLSCCSLYHQKHSLSTPDDMNSLSDNCEDVELLSSFRRRPKTELINIAYQEQNALLSPQHASDMHATYGAI